MPCSSALLGGLAEEETELLQALGKGVLSRHDGEKKKISRKENLEDIKQSLQTTGEQCRRYSVHSDDSLSSDCLALN